MVVFYFFSGIMDNVYLFFRKNGILCIKSSTNNFLTFNIIGIVYNIIVRIINSGRISGEQHQFTTFLQLIFKLNKFFVLNNIITILIQILLRIIQELIGNIVVFLFVSYFGNGQIRFINTCFRTYYTMIIIIVAICTWHIMAKSFQSLENCQSISRMVNLNQRITGLKQFIVKLSRKVR